MQKTVNLRGDQPRVSQSDISRGEQPASLQYRVTSIRDMSNTRSTRREGRD